MAAGNKLVSVDPEELRFQFELEKPSHCDLKVSNTTDKNVAFKVKTTSPKKYFVRPNTGVIQPFDTCIIRVTLQAQLEYPPDMQCKDKFLLQSTPVPAESNSEELPQNTFTKEAGKQLEECKLRVVYIARNDQDKSDDNVKQTSDPSSNPAVQTAKAARDSAVKEVTQLQQELEDQIASMDTVFNCVIPYIQNGDDRNSVSLVCRKWYEIDCLTRKQVTVHEPYAPTPSRLFKRFPFIESLTLKGKKSSNRVDVTRWIREISIKFKCLKSLRIRYFVIRDSDLELLAEKRGKDLRSLKLYECGGFTQNGLMCVAKYCSELKELCLDELELVVEEGEERGKWLRVLALRKTAIEKFSYSYDRYDGVNPPFAQEDVAFLVEKCRESLVSLRVRICSIDAVGAAIRKAVKLQDFFGAFFNNDDEYNGFTFPSTIHRLGLSDLPQGLVPFNIPLLNQLRELELRSTDIREDCQCFFLQRCPNLEVLHTEDVCGDTGLQLISQFCKKLRKLTVRSGTHVGLIAVAQGCPKLEYLEAILLDISNEALECIGSSLKNLRVFCTFMAEKEDKSDLPLDNGIRAMLKGCTNLERLSIHSVDASHVTDVGLGFIGKYGVNLRFLSLTAIGESDEGLSELSKGCPKLRKLELKSCPFSDQAVINFGFNIHSLRYIWVDSGKDIPLALTRLNHDMTAQVLAQLKPYVRLAQRLDLLAKLFVRGTGLKSVSVKVTYSSIGELGYHNTQLLRAMVAKGISLSEEQVILYESSKKQVIEVQIADVESCFEGAISDSGDIKFEGTLKNGVPHLTKVGATEVDVSLEGNINMVILNVLEQFW